MTSVALCEKNIFCVPCRPCVKCFKREVANAQRMKKPLRKEYAEIFIVFLSIYSVSLCEKNVRCPFFWGLVGS